MKLHKTTSGKLLIAVAVILLALLGYYATTNKPATTGGTRTPEAVVENDHIRGAKNPKATLVEYGDLQCPACKAYEPLVAKMLATYPNDLRVVFRHFPLTQIHQNALLAAKYSEAAAIQGKFWEMHDMMYDKQSDWGETLNAEATFKQFGAALGLDVTKLEADSKSQAVEDKILAQYKEGVLLQINHTPTFFLDGVEVDNQNFEQVVGDAIKKAQ